MLHDGDRTECSAIGGVLPFFREMLMRLFLTVLAGNSVERSKTVLACSDPRAVSAALAVIFQQLNRYGPIDRVVEDGANTREALVDGGQQDPVAWLDRAEEALDGFRDGRLGWLALAFEPGSKGWATANSADESIMLALEAIRRARTHPQPSTETETEE